MSTRNTSSRAGARLLALWALSVLVWWGFAFFPAPTSGDSWIVTARVACFGVRPGDPLPLQAWMMLLAAPVMLLAMLLAVSGAELQRAWPSLVRSTRWRVLALLMLSVFTIELRWAVDRGAREARAEGVSFEPVAAGPLPTHFPRTASAVPAFRLVDQEGQPFDATRLRGRPTVMSFVFAHCQTVCPVLANSLTRASRELGPGRATLALVTLDPWRDTPASLPGLANRWSLPSGTRLLSGSPEEVCRLLDTLQVARERDLRTGDVSHVPLVMVLDDEGRIVYRFLNPSVEWIVEAVRRVERGDEVAARD